MAFEAAVHRARYKRRYEIATEITESEDGEVLISAESVTRDGFRDKDRYTRDAKGRVNRVDEKPFGMGRRLEPGVSLFSTGIAKAFDGWQFLNLHAGLMGQPTTRLGGRGARSLDADGSNLAEVVRKLSPAGIDRLVDGLQQVLGYAQDLQVSQFSPVDRTVYLNLKEGGFEVPGWLLSGGTVRIVAILACLYRDEPPPLLVIEEIENGLDPRTVGFLVNQMRDAVQEGKTQIIVTTHSPHFLSQASLEHLLLCQRTSDGEPRFWRPADSKELQKWSEDFHPGELFATGRIQKEMRKAIGEK